MSSATTAAIERLPEVSETSHPEPSGTPTPSVPATAGWDPYEVWRTRVLTSGVPSVRRRC
jgi:hypothetical protein